MTFVILLIFILEKRYEIQMNDTETKNTAVKAPALMSTRPVTAQDALDQCEKLSPMMVHYCQTKTGLTDPANTILFYRLGDFYEMFFEDATLVSKELELTLTGKDCGMEERAPMCGIPYHAAEGYINRLVENGHKVAICEQMEDPKQAKGMVKREVIRVVTPGTTLIPQGLDETSCRSAAWRDAAVSLQQISRPASASSRKWTSRAAWWMRSRSLCRRKSSAISRSCSAGSMWRISGPAFISA